MTVRQGQGIPEATPERPVSLGHLKRKLEGKPLPHPAKVVVNETE